MTRIYLSPPDVGADERSLLLDAFDSGWVAPLGPHVDDFEQEMADRVGVSHAAALSSGTAALHLALVLTGVGRDHDVILPTLTFVATANAVAYTGATPVLVDSSPETWTLDPDLLDEELTARQAAGRSVGAVIAVDLYGQCADYDRLEAVCEAHQVPLIEDAAEALGATYRDGQAGSFGQLAAFSFNGNKIITTAGGGMLVGHDPDVISHARYLATQARDDVPHYEHRQLGFNYRLSNLLAAVGRGQLRRLNDVLADRRRIHGRYRADLDGLPGLAFMPIASYGTPNHWLTVVTIDPDVFGASRDEVRLRLEEIDVEARPVWKPMHLQPLYADAEVRGTAVSESVWQTGLCLPSGNRLTDHDLDRIVVAVRSLGR